MENMYIQLPLKYRCGVYSTWGWRHLQCVAPRTGKFVKSFVLSKEEKICYSMIYYTLWLDSVNRQKRAEKTRLFWKGSGT